MSGFKKYLIIGSLLLVVYLVAQYNKPKPTDWSPSYLASDKIPFGTYILNQRIADLLPQTKIRRVETAIYNSLKEKPAGSSTLFVIASTFKIDTIDFREMVRYMQAGNHVFIAASQFEGIFADTLKLYVRNDFYLKSRAKFPINFVNPLLKRDVDYYFDKGIGGRYFETIDTAKAIVLGEKDNYSANYVQYKFGKGSLFVMPNPQLLTNYSILQEDGMDYVAKTLSYLPQTETLIWNENFLKPKEEGKELSVFLKFEQFKWAYYIALGSLFIFVLFEIKRRQRVIPVIEPLKNTSVQFTETVGRVYYQQRNNRDIAEKKVAYLLAAIRNKYRLKAIDFDNELKEMLIKVSGVNATTIQELHAEVILLRQGYTVTDADLINLNKKIEQFYKQDQ